MTVSAEARARRKPLPYHANAHIDNTLAGLAEIERLTKSLEEAVAWNNKHRMTEAILRIRLAAIEGQRELLEIRKNGS